MSQPNIYSPPGIKKSLYIVLGLLKKSQTVVLMFVCLLIVGAYWNSFSTPFLFDDISSIASKGELYAQDVGALYQKYGMRVVAYLTFKFNFMLHGTDIWGYHLVNLVIHTLVCFTVFILAKTIFIASTNSEDIKERDKALFFATCAAVLFAIHPLQTQAVTYIVQRITALAALFYLVSLLAYLKFRLTESFRVKSTYLVLAVVMALLAFSTKQNTFTLPIVIFFLELIIVRRAKSLALLNPFIVSYFLLGTVAMFTIALSPELISFVDNKTRETTDFSRAQYFETQLSVIALYLKMFILPFNQQVEYIYPVADGSFKNSYHYIGLYAAILIAGGVLSSRLPVVSFAILFYFIAHLVESSVIPISDVVFEHRTYLPNFALALIVAYGVNALFNKSKIAAVSVFSVLTLFFFTLTVERNSVWSDPEKLFKSELAINYDKPRIHGMLGKYYSEQGMFNLSAQSYKNAFELTGDIDEADNKAFHKKFAYFNNYIAAMRRAGNAQQAIDEIFLVMPKVNSKRYMGLIYSNLGFLYLDLGNYINCVGSFFRASKILPKLVEAKIGAAQCFDKMGDPEMAANMFKQAKQLAPKSIKVSRAIEQAGY